MGLFFVEINWIILDEIGDLKLSTLSICDWRKL